MDTNVRRATVASLGRDSGAAAARSARKFVVDFESGPLADLEKPDEVEPVVHVSPERRRCVSGRSRGDMATWARNSV